MTKPLLARVRTFLHRNLAESIRFYYTRFWGMRIGEGSRISLSAKLDKTNPQGIIIGDYTILTFGSVILTHDFIHRRHLPVKIGSYCFVGCGAVILPGVTIGDHCIIGANTLVNEDVPPHSLVVGNPGRVLRRDLRTINWGMIAKPGELLPDGSEPPAPPEQ